MHRRQTYDQPNVLRPLVYMQEPQMVDVGGASLVFQIEEGIPESVAFRMAFARFHDERYGTVNMSFKHIGTTRQVGHKETDLSKQEWYVSGSWYEHLGKSLLWHKVTVSSMTGGETSYSYSLRDVHKNGLKPYSYFSRTLSEGQDSLRAVLGATFRKKDGLELTPDPYQTEKEEIAGVEFNSDYGISLDYLNRIVILRLARHANETAYEETFPITDVPRVIEKQPITFLNGNNPNLLRSAARCEASDSLLRVSSEGVADWSLPRFYLPVISMKGSLNDSRIFNEQFVQWQRFINLIDVRDHILTVSVT